MTGEGAKELFAAGDYSAAAQRYRAALEIDPRCDRFVGNGLSYVSLVVAQMRRWEPGSCRLFGMRLYHLRQITLFQS